MRAVPPPEPRRASSETFGRCEIAVRVNLPSPSGRASAGRDATADPAAERGRRRGPAAAASSAARRSSPAGRSPTRRSPPTRMRLPLLHGERVLGLGRESPQSRARRGERRRRRGRSAAPAAAPSTRCWSGSQANGWSEPTGELARRTPAAEGLDADAGSCWSGARPGARLARLGALRELGDAAAGSGPRCRSCSSVGGTSCAARSTCWSSARAPPTGVDYKTDRLGGSSAGRARRAATRSSD